MADEDPWRERGRAALVGLILAFGVVAMVLLGRRTAGREAAPVAWPAVAGVYRVEAACEGCGCEPSELEGAFAVVHPGLPVGRPAARSCASLEACAAILERRAPPSVRAPVVLAPDADPALVTRELGHGPLLAPDGDGFRATTTREREEGDECVRVRRSSELMPRTDGSWRWVERYESAAGPECRAAEALSCLAERRSRLRPIAR
jgi:hypothetical protein